MKPKELKEKPEVQNRIGNKYIEMPIITLDIHSGPALPTQKAAWHKFFSRLITECQRELKAENEAKND